MGLDEKQRTGIRALPRDSKAKMLEQHHRQNPASASTALAAASPASVITMEKSTPDFYVQQLRDYLARRQSPVLLLTSSSHMARYVK
jgi:hypothetical protein